MPAEQRAEAVLALLNARGKALAAFFAGSKGNAEFLQFCAQLMKAVEEAKNAGFRDSLLPTRQAIIGLGIEAAWQAKRPAGRPAKEKPVDLFFHVWHTLNLEREANGEGHYARVPAKAIAKYCKQHFPNAGGFTAENIRDAVKGVDLPQYLAPTRNGGRK